MIAPFCFFMSLNGKEESEMLWIILMICLIIFVRTATATVASWKVE